MRIQGSVDLTPSVFTNCRVPTHRPRRGLAGWPVTSIPNGEAGVQRHRQMFVSRDAHFTFAGGKERRGTEINIMQGMQARLYPGN